MNYHHHRHLLSKDQKDEYSQHKRSEGETGEVVADRLVGPLIKSSWTICPESEPYPGIPDNPRLHGGKVVEG
jgi:hypothetical protein